MAKDINYNRLINCARWRALRTAYLAEHPWCERCAREGMTVAANCVHHISPVEEAHDLQEMTDRAYRWSNLMALCAQCHSDIHKGERSHSRQARAKRKADRLERWKAAHTDRAESRGWFKSEGVGSPKSTNTSRN